MFRLIKVVLNGFVSAPLKIDQPQSRHVESSFFLLLSVWCLSLFSQNGGIRRGSCFL